MEWFLSVCATLALTLARTHPCCYLLSASCMQSHTHLPFPSSFLSSLHPSRGSPHFPREDSAGDLPTEEEVGARLAVDSAVTSEPATGGGQPELLVPRVPAGHGPPGSHPLTPSRLPFPRRPSPSRPGPQNSQISPPRLALTHVQ